MIKSVFMVKSIKNSVLRHSYSTAATAFRVAVVGSGPAGFYSAYRLLEKLPEAQVDIYESLPVPFGLSRFGVAPDHPEVKNCQDKFIEVAESPRFRYIGNTTVGKDIDLIDLKTNYNSILFAYGSSKDRSLNIPGENLPGVFSAREFVGWYNGFPELAGLNPPLQDAETVSIIGNGNVALDVARVLLCDPERLKSTDITEEAYNVLKKSNVRHVHIIGRRGILQSAFTTKEIRELINEPGVTMMPLNEKDIEPYRAFLPMLGRVKKRMVSVIDKASKAYDPEAAKQKNLKSFSLDYLLSPSTFYEGKNPKLLSASELEVNVLDQSDIDSPAQPVPTGEKVVFKNELVFKSIGYKAVALQGMDQLNISFDTRRGIVPNTFGRVLVTSNTSDSHQDMVPGKGLYVTGWVKTGPTGVIASTMREAFEVAETMIEDYYTNKVDRSLKPGFDGVAAKIQESTRIVSWADWQKIDKAELDRGKNEGKSRSKFTSTDEMLQVLD